MHGNSCLDRDVVMRSKTSNLAWFARSSFFSSPLGWGCMAAAALEEELWLNGLSRQIRSLQRQASRRAKDAELCGLTPHSVLLTVLVYILSRYDVAVTISFAESCRNRRKRLLDPMVRAKDFPIRDWFLSFPLQRLETLLDATTEADQKLHAKAWKHICAHRAAVWVVEQNYQQHVAPTYRDVVERYYADLSKHVDASFEKKLRPNGRLGRVGRKWAQRFCARFALRRRSLATTNGLPFDELVEKARVAAVFASLFEYYSPPGFSCA